MASDLGFIEAIRANPKDDALLLIYADWLDEQGDPVSSAKSEFLRQTVQSVKSWSNKARKAGRKARHQRLQQLAAELDTDWLEVVSRLAVEGCQKKRTGIGSFFRFGYQCERRWEGLSPTEEHAVRFCDTCEKTVHYCDTIMDARQQAAQGHCIAVDLGIIRRKGDLEPAGEWLGRPSVETLREEAERLRPDPVSEERDRRRRERGEGRQD
jgi:uncharacterized protein (TIGR02996 family)